MEIFGKVDARSRVAILAGENQRGMVDVVDYASKAANFGFRVVDIDEEESDLIVLIDHPPDDSLVQKYGLIESEEPYQARLLETHTQLWRPEMGRLVAGYALRIVTANGDRGPVVAERAITMDPNSSPSQLDDTLAGVVRIYLPYYIREFLEERKLAIAES